MPSSDRPADRGPAADAEPTVDTTHLHPLPRLELPVPRADARAGWRAAHDEASRALAAWMRGSIATRAEAYSVYVAAVDREDAALRPMARSTDVDGARS
jgi:hypothetical protein